MRNWKEELELRASWIKGVVDGAKANGIILGFSGGKDCALVSLIAKHAGVKIVGISMPCGNIQADEDDAAKFAKIIDVEFKVINIMEPFLTLTHNSIKTLGGVTLGPLATSNVKPRLRMTTLYALGQEMGYLVAGTGNASEIAMGYFTKWGDGAFDLNPMADLTATEVIEFLRFFNEEYLDNQIDFIVNRVPSAGLYFGQTDEDELGISYANIDKFILTGEATPENKEIIRSAYVRNSHKRMNFCVYQQPKPLIFD